MEACGISGGTGTNYPRLAANHIESPTWEIERGTPTVWAKARDSYKANRFSVTAETLEPLLENPETEVEASYLLGHVYRELGNYNKSIETFKRVIRAEHLKSQEAHWNIALVCMLKDDPETAKPHLQAAAEGGGDLGREAEELLQELD